MGFKPAHILITILIIATLWRGWLIQTDSVKLNSDEAVVGLMARHITQGKSIPTFYYGQDYMGSLDGLLIAGGFEFLGESVRTIRIVQAALYLLTILTAYLLALEITRQQTIALMTALLLAIPTMLGTLYTSLTLGGYNELILFGNLALLLGWGATVGDSGSFWRWALLGLVLGLGWWTNGAIITPIVVVGFAGPALFQTDPLAALSDGGAGLFHRRRALVDLQPQSRMGRPGIPHQQRPRRR